ncbi:protein PHLOEM PROTEIN 2-LIKE A2-like [Euphorbia lathyris]|uniref:protein PHLOEM PROTEIN 2-LIKE A2-like n=1 Tax=Euphorbia lathyris TaxID=212925 RepID=UPI003313F5BB
MEEYCDHRNGIHLPHWKSDGSSEYGEGGSYKIGVKGLNIIWGNDPRFWQFIKLSEEDIRLTGCKEGAVLLQVNWIEVTGKIPIRLENSCPRKLEILYMVKFREDAFGWHSIAIKFKLKFNGEEKIKSHNLELFRDNNEKSRWHEINGGDFTIQKDGVLEFGMFEVETDWWKGGIILAGVKIKPIL